jgi:hypothetical protein
MGAMSLRECEVEAATVQGRDYAIAFCGDYALTIAEDTGTDAEYWVAESRTSVSGRRHDALLLDASNAGWLRATTLRTLGIGALPPPGTIQVTRGCRYPSCGWWANLPPKPVPCPNPHLVSHPFT